MRAHAHRRSTDQDSGAGAGRPLPIAPALLDWQGPTLQEFIRQVQHSFGGVDLSGLRHAGIDRDEPLDPLEIRELCELLGLPPEDFGVT